MKDADFVEIVRRHAMFDLVVHLDRTRAVEPLEKWGRHEVDLPEMYPTGV